MVSSKGRQDCDCPENCEELQFKVEYSTKALSKTRECEQGILTDSPPVFKPYMDTLKEMIASNRVTPLTGIRNGTIHTILSEKMK